MLIAIDGALKARTLVGIVCEAHKPLHIGFEVRSALCKSGERYTQYAAL
jgi:hypothetical protein